MTKKIKLLFRLMVTVLISWMVLQCAAANDLIMVQFVQRPPYMMQSESGAVEGLLTSRVAQIFNRAGIAMQWNMTSLNRQWDALLKPNVMTCSIGWFKTREREKIAKFTNAIYQDQQFVLLARKQFSISPNDSLQSLLEMKGTRVLLKDRYSYGPTIDELLKKYQASIVLSDAENWQMVKLLAANRADFMFAAKEEAEYLVEHSDPNLGLQILNPKNMPKGEKRYMACNQLVTDELIERLNRANPF